MSNYNYGDLATTVNFGTPNLRAYGVITNNLNLGLSSTVQAMVENEIGLPVVERRSGVKTDFSFEGTANTTSSYSTQVGSIISVTGSYFGGSILAIVDKFDSKLSNKGYTTVTLTAHNYDSVDYAVSSSI
jgi:hypothetical protein